MGILTRNLYSIVTTVCLVVGYSTSAVAQMSMDERLEALREAAPADAARLTREIEREWSLSGSTALDLIMRRGTAALEDNDTRLAIEHFTALTDHAPDFAEGFHLRARAYFMAEKFGPALADLQRTLALNPQHYNALYGLGIMFRELGDPARAQEAFEAALALNPHHEEATDALKRLEASGIGRSL